MGIHAGLLRRSSVYLLFLSLAAIVSFQLWHPTASRSDEVPCAQTGNETVSLDRNTYSPGDTVQVTGVGYGAACDVVVRVTAPDGTVTRNDGTPGADQVATSGDGNLAYDYYNWGVDGGGDFQVDVLGAEGVVLAHTSYYDPCPCAISGTALIDTNGNGASDPGETTVVPSPTTWTATLKSGSTTVAGPTALTSTGTYSFGSLANGTYTVTLNPPSSSFSTTNSPLSVTLNNNSKSGQDLRAFQNVSVSGQVFADSNGNGVIDAGEPGAASSVKLDTGSAVATAADGTYTFTNVGPGTHTITNVPPSGWTQTFPASAGTLSATPSSGTNVTGKNFANFQNASISGRVFNDQNNNGNDDGGTEAGVPGVTVTLYKETNGTSGLQTGNGQIDTVVGTPASTSASGAYSFSAGPGTYYVAETVPVGGTQTTPTSPNTYYTVSSTSNGAFSGRNFGVFSPGSIAGRAFTDTSGNGADDGTTTDPGLSGTAVTLYNDVNGNGVIDSPADTVAGTTSSASTTGNYSFTNLTAGTYIVQETPNAGYIQTFPTPTKTYALSVASGTAFTGKSFGNFQLATISGQKFEDVNGNGTLDSREPSLGGWTIYATTNADGSQMTGGPSAVTSSSNGPSLGTYSLLLGPGTYKVREVAQEGWTQSTNNPADLVINHSGQTASAVNFGNFHNVSVSGKAFNDYNGNGVQDPGEPNLAGWTIALDNTTTTTTDSSGNYSFTNAVGSGTHTISESLQNGWTQSAPASGGTFTITTGSCGATANCSVITSGGSTVTGRNFANWQPQTLSGVAFNDYNGSGAQDAGEPSLSGWSISLGGVTKTTAEDGSYSFRLGTGAPYTISETVQSGWIQIAPSSGSYTGTVVSGGASGLNFATLQGAVIQGTVFEDNNGDGALNGSGASADKGREGWTVFLDLNGNGQWDPDQGEAAAVSLGDGHPGQWTIGNLPTGSYPVREVLQDGYTLTTTLRTVTITPPGQPGDGVAGGTVSNVNIGNFANVTLSGTAFEDANGDGTQQQGEPALSGWTLTLDGGTLTTTNAGGAYSFPGTGPGTHTVTATPPSTDWTETTPTSSGFFTANTGSCVGVDNCLGFSSGNAPSAMTFGFFHNVTISGVTFQDMNGNGSQDTGDTGGVSGATVSLDGHPISPNTDGTFSFPSVGPGSHTITQTLPGVDADGNGWTATLPGSADVYTLTTGRCGGTQNCATFTSGDTTDVANQNFGDFHNVTINGVKYEDMNGNGHKDDNDPALSGLTIKLDQTGGGPCQVLAHCVQTADDGTYSFVNVGPGTHRVSEVHQSHWTQTAPGAGGEYVTTTDSCAGVDNCDPITSGDAHGKGKNNHFGDFHNVTFSGTVLEDMNGDGQPDASDTNPVAGSTVLLSDNTTPTDTTNGAYSFEVGPGHHTVTNQPLTGWTLTGNNAHALATDCGTDATCTTITSGDRPGLGRGRNFLAFHNVTITGAAYEDMNGNGAPDANDTNPVPGATIGLDSLAPTTADPGNGSYTFSNVGPGHHAITQLSLDGWTLTGGHSQALATDCGTDTGCTTFTSGQAVNGKHFGFFHNVTISGAAYEDMNGNGSPDTADTNGASGAQISLDGGPAAALGNGGTFSFPGTGPGKHTVSLGDLSGWTQTTPNHHVLATDCGTDSGCVTFTSGDSTHVGGKLFGLFHNVTINGATFEDMNGDGTQDPGDTNAVPGATFRLDANGPTSADNNGNYSFTNVGPGPHTITQLPLSGWTLTTNAGLTHSLSTNCGSDTTCTAFTSGAGLGGRPAVPGRHFGAFHNVTIDGVTFEDMNGNGLKDTGDTGIPFSVVNLDTSNVQSTLADGSFSFDNIGPGSHNVGIVTPSGWTLTSPGLGGVHNLRTGDCTGVANCAVFTSGDTVHVRGHHFGLFHNVTISGLTFEDMNGNGLLESGDVGPVPGSLVSLDGRPGATPSSDGTYSFTNIGPGSHNVAPTTPSGWTMTTPGSGGVHNLTTGSCTGVANCVTFTSGDTVHPSGHHFGFFHNVAISGVAFEDLNGNGVKDSNDPILPNWTVKLDSSGSQLTGSDGSYSFTNVGPGPHSVSEVLQSAWIQTAPGTGGVHNLATLSCTNIANCLIFHSGDSTNVANHLFGNRRVADVGITKGATGVGFTSTVASNNTTITKNVPGTTVTYTVTVKNWGPNIAQAVNASDVIPANTTWAGFVGTPPCTQSAGSISCTSPNLAAPAGTTYSTFTFSYKVTVNENFVGTIAGTAGTSEAWSAELLPDAHADSTPLSLPTACTKTGTSGNDSINLGTSTSNNVICGLGGADVIYGGHGNDILSGGDGNDTIYGGDGNDVIFGGSGDDRLYGQNGTDLCNGGIGSNTLSTCEGTA